MKKLTLTAFHMSADASSVDPDQVGNMEQIAFMIKVKLLKRKCPRLNLFLC